MAEYRAEMLAKLDALEAGAWGDVRDPGPKTSVTGTVIKDPSTGEPLPDRAVVDQARNTILKTVRARMDLLGLAAPRKSMSLQMTAELDSENETLQAQLADVYQAALEERDRELDELRGKLAAALQPGPAVLQGKAEEP